MSAVKSIKDSKQFWDAFSEDFGIVSSIEQINRPFDSSAYFGDIFVGRDGFLFDVMSRPLKRVEYVGHRTDKSDHPCVGLVGVNGVGKTRYLDEVASFVCVLCEIDRNLFTV